MTTVVMLERLQQGRVNITNGPDRMLLAASVFEGSPVEFTLEVHRTGIAVILWGIRCKDSGRRNWTYWGKTSGGEFGIKGSYWMRDGKREGYMEIEPTFI